MKIKDILHYLDEKYNQKIALDFDNPGLLIGNKNNELNGVLVTLDVTNNSIKKAIKNNCNLIISHHPLIFHSIKKIDINSVVGKHIELLIKNKISVFSIHTNFDAHYDGMTKIVNEKIKKYIDLKFISYIEDIPFEDKNNFKYGIGSINTLSKKININTLIKIVEKEFIIKNLRYYKANNFSKKIAICPGSGKSLVNSVIENKCDTFITSDLAHNDILDLNEMNISYIDATHYGLEKVFIDYICKLLKSKYLIKVVKYDNFN
ncbi:MAG: Nif3-like dinuclear metal center hexameric protein [Eubacteriales bacterium]|nr:Nif3-like dinuclear metal center hexameric protein [Eubacteriales bacterium]